MINNKWVLGFLFTIFASIAFAQTPISAREKKVEKLLEVVHFEKMVEQQTDLIVNNLIKQPQFAKHEKEFKEIFSEMLNIKTFKKEMVIVYLNTFTEKEIDEMIKFNQSPLGQKILSKMPEISNQMLEKMQVNLEKNQKKLQDLIVRISLENTDEQS